MDLTSYPGVLFSKFTQQQPAGGTGLPPEGEEECFFDAQEAFPAEEPPPSPFLPSQPPPPPVLLPPSLMEPIRPSAATSGSNGCFPLPIYIPLPPLPPHEAGSFVSLIVQLSSKASAQLQQQLSSEASFKQLSVLAVQQGRVLLDFLPDLSNAAAFSCAFPKSELRQGLVNLYILLSSTSTGGHFKQPHVFASLPILVLLTAHGRELENLLGSLIQAERGPPQKSNSCPDWMQLNGTMGRWGKWLRTRSLRDIDTSVQGGFPTGVEQAEKGQSGGLFLPGMAPTSPPFLLQAQNEEGQEHVASAPPEAVSPAPQTFFDLPSSLSGPPPSPMRRFSLSAEELQQIPQRWSLMGPVESYYISAPAVLNRGYHSIDTVDLAIRAPASTSKRQHPAPVSLDIENSSPFKHLTTQPAPRPAAPHTGKAQSTAYQKLPEKPKQQVSETKVPRGTWDLRRGTTPTQPPPYPRASKSPQSSPDDAAKKPSAQWLKVSPQKQQQQEQQKGQNILEEQQQQQQQQQQQGKQQEQQEEQNTMEEQQQQQQQQGEQQEQQQQQQQQKQHSPQEAAQQAQQQLLSSIPPVTPKIVAPPSAPPSVQGAAVQAAEPQSSDHIPNFHAGFEAGGDVCRKRALLSVLPLLSSISAPAPPVAQLQSLLDEQHNPSAGVVAAPKRVLVYGCSRCMVASVYSSRLAPLCMDLGYILDVAERCMTSRAIAAATGSAQPHCIDPNVDEPSSPGSYSSKVLVGKDAVLLLQLMEDLDLLFAHHGMFLLQGLLQDAARQLQDG